SLKVSGIHGLILADFANLPKSPRRKPGRFIKLRPYERLLMRKISTSLMLSLAAVLLAACSSAPPAVPLSVISETETTRLIEHTFGQTEIPAQPQRVFALGEEGLLANLLDAGITPVGSNVNLTNALPLFSAAELEGVALYQTSGQFSLEAIAKAE